MANTKAHIEAKYSGILAKKTTYTQSNPTIIRYIAKEVLQAIAKSRITFKLDHFMIQGM